VLRLPGVYGSGDEGKSIINKFVESAVIKGKITIFGDGEDTRDYIYANDVFRIIEMAVSKKLNETINIATGKSYSINKIVEIIKSSSPKDFIIEYKSKENCGEERVKALVYNISLLNKFFPNFKFTGLKKGISLYMKDKYQIKKD
jgi:nucleoside-diphosphate-sugar epimerase